MDFLGVGVQELVVIIIIALIFIGPRDMPKMAVRAAKFLRQLRAISDNFSTEWRREINALANETDFKEFQELHKEVKAARSTLNTIGADLVAPLKLTPTPDTVARTPTIAPPTPPVEPPPPTTSTPTTDDSITT